ncbi:CD48 antigen [Labeo rohita]|uniref:CD48 antigen n=1 Tax=Labeo rohita TaxID=84645 RepID=A0ABQ8L652_LABRO|nr:CD48 antigen [Labeo rohita]
MIAVYENRSKQTATKLLTPLNKDLFSISSGFGAEISVFVQTGDSVQLDIQTQELPEFDDLYWTKDQSENIVKYSESKDESKRVRIYNSYKNRVDFNNKTFSLMLMNMQKTDNGLYTAKTVGELNKNIITYKLLVIDAVDAPVLTLTSDLSSSDPCNFTCKGSNIIISFTYNSSCSPEEVTSDIYTLRLGCSDDFIMCNYSNPVSWKTDTKKVNELCPVNKGAYCIRPYQLPAVFHTNPNSAIPNPLYFKWSFEPDRGSQQRDDVPFQVRSSCCPPRRQIRPPAHLADYQVPGSGFVKRALPTECLDEARAEEAPPMPEYVSRSSSPKSQPSYTGDLLLQDEWRETQSEDDELRLQAQQLSDIKSMWTEIKRDSNELHS